MFRQEINLYQFFKAPPPVTSFLNWRIFWLTNLAFFIMFLLMALYSVYELHHLKTRKIEMAQEIQSLQSKFFNIKKNYPAFFFSQDAEKTIEQMKHDLVVEQALLASIAKRMPFSEALIAFSRTITPNVWLTEIAINKGSDEIILKGHSLSMDSMQLFLTNLIKDALFKDYSINISRVENPTQKDVTTGILNFEINLTKKTV